MLLKWHLLTDPLRVGPPSCPYGAHQWFTSTRNGCVCVTRLPGVKSGGPSSHTHSLRNLVVWGCILRPEGPLELGQAHTNSAAVRCKAA